MLLLPSFSLSHKIHSAVAVALLLAAVSAHAATTFTAINDPLGTSEGTRPNGVNGAYIVGTYYGANFVSYGFIYNGTGFITVNDPSANYTNLCGVDGPNVVGYSEDDFGHNHGILYNSNGLVEFDVEGGANSTSAYDISGNNVVGNYFADETSHGFIYNLNTQETLVLDDPEASAAGGGTYAQGIDGNIVVGYYYTGNQSADPPSSVAHGFFYNGTAYVTLDDPKASTGPYEGTYASGVSNGVIVGYYYKGQNVVGFVYNTKGVFTDVTKTGAGETYLTAIDGNTVVGYSQPGGNGDNAYNSSGFVTTLATSTNTTATFTTSPSNQFTDAGTNATFTIGVSPGVPAAKLQWQIFLNGNWTNITAASFKSGNFTATFAGYTTASLTVVKPLAPLDQKQFRLVATNSSGAVDSFAASLSVSVPTLTISDINVAGPNSTTVASDNGIYYPLASQGVVFSVTASGAANLTYQWYLGTKAIAKATGANYTIAKFAAANSGNYSVIVTNPPSGATARAGTPIVQLNVNPTFPKAPANVTIPSGATGNLTVTVAGNPTPTVVWQVSQNGTNWNNVQENLYYSGETTTTLTINATTADLNGLHYRVMATDPVAGTPVFSKSATLTITPPVPTLDPSLQGKYQISSMVVNLLGGGNMTVPLTSTAQAYTVTLGPTGLAGAAASVEASILKFAGVTTAPKITVTSATPTTYNATVSGTAAYNDSSIGSVSLKSISGTIVGNLVTPGTITVTTNITGTASVLGIPLPGSTLALTVILTKE